MKAKERIPCDYAKLKALFRQREIRITDASKKLGRSESFLTHLNRNPYLTLASAKHIQAVFGIRPEEYAPDLKPKDDPKKPERPAREAQPAADLSDDIKALKQSVDTLCGILKAAFEARFEHDQRVEQTLTHAFEPMTLYKSLFTPIYNAMRTAQNDGPKEPVRRIDGTIIRGGRT